MILRSSNAAMLGLCGSVAMMIVGRIIWWGFLRSRAPGGGAGDWQPLSSSAGLLQGDQGRPDDRLPSACVVEETIQGFKT